MAKNNKPFFFWALLCGVALVVGFLLGGLRAPESRSATQAAPPSHPRGDRREAHNTSPSSVSIGTVPSATLGEIKRTSVSPAPSRLEEEKFTEIFDRVLSLEWPEGKNSTARPTAEGWFRDIRDLENSHHVTLDESSLSALLSLQLEGYRQNIELTDRVSKLRRSVLEAKTKNRVFLDRDRTWTTANGRLIAIRPGEYPEYDALDLAIKDITAKRQSQIDAYLANLKKK